MIRRLFYASPKLGTHQKSGDNVEVEGVRVGHCTGRRKDKSKEKTCIKGGKQTVRRTNRQEKQSLKRDTQKSLLFLFYSPSSVLERHSISKLETYS